MVLSVWLNGLLRVIKADACNRGGPDERPKLLFTLKGCLMVTLWRNILALEGATRRTVKVLIESYVEYCRWSKGSSMPCWLKCYFNDRQMCGGVGVCLFCVRG